MKQSINNLMQERILDYGFASEIALIHALSSIPLMIVGFVGMSKIGLLYSLWISGSLLALTSILCVLCVKKLRWKFVLFGTHYLCIIVLQILCFVFLFSNRPVIVMGFFVLLFIGSVIRGLVKGCYKAHELSTQIKCNDLYYYDEIDGFITKDAQSITQIRPYILPLIIQTLLLIAYVVVITIFGIDGLRTYAFLAFPFHESFYHHIPLSFFKARFLKQERVDL